MKPYKYHNCATCEHSSENSNICDTCEKIGVSLPSNYEIDVPYPATKHKAAKPKAEEVNHPDHYNNGKYECIEVMAEIFGIEKTQTFCELNAFKYLWRSEHKGKKAVDVDKANWYLNKYKELEERKKT